VNPTPGPTPKRGGTGGGVSDTAAMTSPHAAPLGRPLHVAIVDEELPYPPTSGKRIRTLNLVLRLAARHRLTYLCHRNADPCEAVEAARFFLDNGITPVVVDRPVPPRSGPGFYARLALNLLSPLPYSVASHASSRLRAALAEHARTQPVDLWHCEWTPYAQVLRRRTEAPRLVMAHNVESVIWQRYHENERHPLKRWYIGVQWRKYAAFERTALTEAERVVAVSDLDAERLRSDFGVPAVDVVENGVDTARFRPQSGKRVAARLLFLGSLDWRPNLDAVGLLLDRIFPAIRAAEPGATLQIVGRQPPPALVQRVAGLPGVELHADVPDVVPYLNGCGCLVVPLRIGGGSRLKILEALACGTPVVATRIGAEGLHLEPGRHLSIADSPQEFSAAALAALRDPQAARQQADCGRQRVLERYDWEGLARRLDALWHDTAARGMERHTQTRRAA
jgi:glycosyltransferase involved in cell wall biosynthesis